MHRRWEPRKSFVGLFVTIGMLVPAVPVSGQSNEGTGESPIRADAPDTLLPAPEMLRPATPSVGAPTASPAAAAPARLVAEIPASGAQPVFDPLAGHFVVVHAEGIMAVSPDGELIAESNDVVPIDVRLWDGGVFAADGSFIYEIDSTTLAVTTHPVGVYPRHMAVLDDEIWVVAARETSFRVIDRATGTTRTVPFPAGVDAANLTSIRHAPLLGDRFVVTTFFGTGMSHLIDVSGPAPSVAWSLSGERVSTFSLDGRMFSSSSNRAVLTTRDPFTAVEISSTDVGLFLDPRAVHLADADLLVSDRQLIDLQGEVIRNDLVYNGRRAVLSGDGRRALVGDSASLDVHSLEPSVESTHQAFFQPGWYDALHLRGRGFESFDLTVRVNGVVVPASADSNLLTVDVSGLPDSTDVEGRITLTDRLGSSAFVIPSTPGPGRAALHVRVVDAQPTNNSGVGSVQVDCRLAEGLPGEAVALVGALDDMVFDVPGGRECHTRVGSAHNTRSGAFDPAGPLSFVDLHTNRVDVLTGRPVHLLFIGDLPLEPEGGVTPAPLWVFVGDIGGGPEGLDYAVRVACGSWSTTVRIRAGFGARLQPPAGREYGDCRARVTNTRGALRVSSVAARPVLSQVGTRTIEFDRFTSYVSFRMDFGRAEITVPQVIGVPNEDLGARRDAGMVHLLPVDGIGHPTARGALSFRQGRGGLGERAEAGDRFGASTVVGDFNGDGWLDVAIGAPGEDIAGKRDAGIVHVIYGGRDGYSGTLRQRFSQASPGFGERPEGFDLFGDSLTTVDFNGDGYLDLAIGVPGEGVNGRKRAGMVQVVLGGPGGLSEANGVVTLTKENSGFETPARAGDRFGTSIDGWRTLLAIGAPGEDVNGAGDAGAVHVIDGAGGETQVMHQTARRGIPEPGDRLGSSVSIAEATVVAGAPGEDEGRRRNVGAVNMWAVNFADQRIRAPQIVDLKTMNLRGDLPAGARFGSQVRLFGTVHQGQILISAPGYRIEGDRAAGRVFIAFDASFNSGGFWSQEYSGVPGTAGPQVRFGDAFDVNRRGGLVISAPGSTVAGTANAGAVYATRDGVDWVQLNQRKRGLRTPPEPGDRFGSTLAS